MKNWFKQYRERKLRKWAIEQASNVSGYHLQSTIEYAKELYKYVKSKE